MKIYPIILAIWLCFVPFTMGQKQKTTPTAPANTAKAKEADVKVNPHPLFGGITVGVDLYEPVVRLFGQKYGGYELSVEGDFYNRFFPVWEIGIGNANSTPENLNYTYIGKTSLYNRIGINYNFTYKSTSRNYMYIGLRYGFSMFKYDIKDITINNDYWGDNIRTDLLNQHSTAHWAELVGGVRVNIVAGFYMGWTVRYKFEINTSTSPQSSPWYIPGYGTEGNPLGITYSVYYKF